MLSIKMIPENTPKLPTKLAAQGLKLLQSAARTSYKAEFWRQPKESVSYCAGNVAVLPVLT